MADPSEKYRGSRPYLPPPPDDSPESIDVPRMEPPPPSLEAMVRSRPGSPLRAEQGAPIWAWVAVLVAAVVAVASYLVLH